MQGYRGVVTLQLCLYTLEVPGAEPRAQEREPSARMIIPSPADGEQGAPAIFRFQSSVALSLGLSVSPDKPRERKLRASYLTQNVPIIGITLNPRTRIAREVWEGGGHL